MKYAWVIWTVMMLGFGAVFGAIVGAGASSIERSQRQEHTQALAQQAVDGWTDCMAQTKVVMRLARGCVGTDYDGQAYDKDGTYER